MAGKSGSASKPSSFVRQRIPKFHLFRDCCHWNSPFFFGVRKPPFQTMPLRIKKQKKKREEGQNVEECANGRHSNAKRKDLATAEVEGCVEVARKSLEIPEELVEMIIARMPFPSLYKAASLSKAWHSNFAVSSSRVRPPALSFQAQVASVSSRWATYCPVYVGTEGIVGFDQNSRQWRSIMPLSYLPTNDWRFAAFAGALMCVSAEGHSKYDCDLLVTNVITKRWRRLPQPLHHLQLGHMLSPQDHLKFLPLESYGYRVLVLHRAIRILGTDGILVEIYDSKLQAWTLRETSLPYTESFFFSDSAFLDEKLYLVNKPFFRAQKFLHLWMYDVHGDLWTRIPQVVRIEDVMNGAALRCGGKIMVAALHGTNEHNGRFESFSISIFELLVSSLLLEHVETGPQDSIVLDVDLRYPAFYFASDADNLYFRWIYPTSKVLTFNVQTHKWNSLSSAPWETSLDRRSPALGGFEPGMNPFVVV